MSRISFDGITPFNEGVVRGFKVFRVRLTHVFRRSWRAGEDFIGEERIRFRREVIMFRRWEDVVVYFWEVDWKPFRIVVKRRVNRRTPFMLVGEVKILGWGTKRRGVKRGSEDERSEDPRMSEATS